MASQRTRSPASLAEPDTFCASEPHTAVHACADEDRPGPRRTRSGPRRATRRSPDAICATLFGAGAIRLIEAAPRRWELHHCRNAVEVLDRAPLSEVVIFCPAPAETRAAFDTLSALRNSGHAVPVIFLVHLGPRRDMASPDVREAIDRGARLVLAQFSRPEYVFEAAASVVSDEALESLRASMAPPPTPTPPPRQLLRHGDLRIEDGSTYRGEARIQLAPSEYRLLVYLLEHAGRAVSKDEVEANVAQAHLSESAFRNRIMKLRRAIGDDAGNVIQTSRSQYLSYGIGIGAQD
jgi:DNA-binding response OmpR family regulator